MASRRATRGRRGFIWLPRDNSFILEWDIKINGESVREDIFDAEFTRGLCPESGKFEIDLINADQKYSTRYQQGQTVQLFMDFSSGTTKRFEGKIDNLKNAYNKSKGFIFTVGGNHLTRGLLDITATKSFSGDTTADQIIKDIISEFAPEYNTTNVTASTDTPTINWNNKPIWECILDLTKTASFDSYVDNDLGVHFFERETINNDGEAIVWNDTLLNADNIGEQTLTTRNRVIVYGDDGASLPVISTADDPTSQSLIGIKEEVVFDTKVNSFSYAQDLAQAELITNTREETEGDDIECLILPSLSPGDMIYFSNPIMNLNKRVAVYQITHRLPMERTIVTVRDERKVKEIFRKRIQNELAAQTIVNPNKMLNSLNLPFDNLSELSSFDTNVQITDGKISLSSGVDGVFTSITQVSETTITKCEVRVVGSETVGTIYKVSADNGSNFEVVQANIPYTFINPGKNISIKVQFTSATTEIESIAVLYK